MVFKCKKYGEVLPTEIGTNQANEKKTVSVAKRHTCPVGYYFAMMLMLVLCALVCCLMSSCTGDASYKQLMWESNASGEISITGCDTLTKPTKIVIPEELDGKPVTAISELAFAKEENLKEITIPDSVTEIGDAAFRECGGLQKVKLLFLERYPEK